MLDGPWAGEGEVRWILSDTADSGTLFQIKDNGPGIPESIRDTIFDAFTTSGKPEGTGLGLAIVRQCGRGPWRLSFFHNCDR